MHRSSAQTRIVVITIVLLSLGFAHAAPAPQQAPPQQGGNVTVTVSAAEAGRVDTAIHDLQKNGDGFIATTVVENIQRLTQAMAQPGRSFSIGPLASNEAALIDLPALLRRHATPEGPIHIQIRSTETVDSPEVFTLRQSAFVLFCTDLVDAGVFRSGYEKHVKTIALSRMIVDLSNQEDGLIPGPNVLVGLMKTFGGEDKNGTKISARVLDIALAMTDRLSVYDMVPADIIKAFDKWTVIERQPVFAPIDAPIAGRVNIRHGGTAYTTTVEHFVWFFLGFYLVESHDHDNVRMGGAVLDYLVAQIKSETIAEALTVIAGAPPGRAIVLGDFRARGPRIDTFENAPAVERRPSVLGADDYVEVVRVGR